MIIRANGALGSKRAAFYSDCQRYRYRLDIGVGAPGLTRCTFVMLNPSTATELVDDPTVAKCARFSRMWGFDLTTIVNIFAWRATDPRKMREVAEPIGADNDAVILGATTHSDLIICAWGLHGEHLARGERVRALLSGCTLHYLRLTKVHPWHPLYLPLASRPIRWNP